MSGSDGLRALSNSGVFEELFSHLRETWIAGSYDKAANSVCDLLQTALTDEATAEAARRIIARIAESMPPETDALDASDARLAASLIQKLAPINADAKTAATKQVLLDADVLPKLLKALDQDEWSVLRSSLREPVTNAVAGLLDETAGDGLARFCALGGAKALAERKKCSPSPRGPRKRCPRRGPRPCASPRAWRCSSPTAARCSPTHWAATTPRSTLTSAVSRSRCARYIVVIMTSA